MLLRTFYNVQLDIYLCSAGSVKVHLWWGAGLWRSSQCDRQQRPGHLARHRQVSSILWRSSQCDRQQKPGHLARHRQVSYILWWSSQCDSQQRPGHFATSVDRWVIYCDGLVNVTGSRRQVTSLDIDRWVIIYCMYIFLEVRSSTTNASTVQYEHPRNTRTVSELKKSRIIR